MIVEDWTDEELEERLDQQSEIWLEKVRLSRMYPDMTDEEIKEAVKW